MGLPRHDDHQEGSKYGEGSVHGKLRLRTSYNTMASPPIYIESSKARYGGGCTGGGRKPEESRIWMLWRYEGSETPPKYMVPLSWPGIEI